MAEGDRGDAGEIRSRRRRAEHPRARSPTTPSGKHLVYLLDTDAPRAVVDTGWDDPTSWDALAAAPDRARHLEPPTSRARPDHPSHRTTTACRRRCGGVRAWIAMHEAASPRRCGAPGERPARRYAYMAAVKPTAASAPRRRDCTSPAAAQPPVDAGRLRAVWSASRALPTAHHPRRPARSAGPQLRAISTPATRPRLPPPRRGPLAQLPGNGRLFSGDHVRRHQPHIGSCTRTPTTPPSPIRSATRLDSLERAGSVSRRGPPSPPAHTFTDAPARVQESCSTTTSPPHRSARLLATPSRPGSSRNGWSGTAPGPTSPTAPEHRGLRGGGLICAGW